MSTTTTTMTESRRRHKMLRARRESLQRRQSECESTTTTTHYPQVRITPLPLHDNKDIDEQRSFDEDLPLTLGRINLAGWWWRSCPSCQEDSQTTPTKNNKCWKPSRFCPAYCRPVAQQVDRLSKAMLTINANGTLENCARHAELVHIQSKEKGVKKIAIGEPGETPWMAFRLEFLRGECAESFHTAKQSSTPASSKEPTKRKAITPTSAKDKTPEAKSGQRLEESQSPSCVVNSNSSWIFPPTEMARKLRQDGTKKRPRSLQFPEQNKEQYGASVEAPEAARKRRKETVGQEESLRKWDQKPQAKANEDANGPQNEQPSRAENIMGKRMDSASRDKGQSIADLPRRDPPGSTKSQYTAHSKGKAQTADPSANQRSPHARNIDQDKVVTPKKANQSKAGKHSKSNRRRVDSSKPSPAKRTLFSQEDTLPAEEINVTTKHLLSLTLSTLSERSHSTNSIMSNQVGGQPLHGPGSGRKWSLTDSTRETNASKKPTQDKESAQLGIKLTPTQSVSQPVSPAVPTFAMLPVRDDDDRKRPAEECEHNSSQTKRQREQPVKERRERRSNQSSSGKNDNSERGACKSDKSRYSARRETNTEHHQSGKSRTSKGKYSSSQPETAQFSVFSQSQLQAKRNDASQSTELELEHDHEGSSGLSLSKSPVIHCGQQWQQHVASQPNENSSPGSQEMHSQEETNFETPQSQNIMRAGARYKLPSFRGLMLNSETGASSASSRRSGSKSQLSLQVASQMNPPSSQPAKKTSSLSIESQSQLSAGGGIGAASQPVQKLTELPDSDDSSVLSLGRCDKMPSTQTSLIIMHGNATQNEENARQREHWENLQRTGAGSSKASRALINLVVEMNKGRNDSAPFRLPSLLDGC